MDCFQHTPSGRVTPFTCIRTCPGQTTPARMHGGHHAAVFSGQQHRQTIGHHDGAGQLSLPRDAGVCDIAVASGKVKCKHLAAMHLLQEYRPTADGLLQRGAVGGDFFGRVADVIAQIHAVKRCA